MSAPLFLQCRLQHGDHDRPLLDLLCRRFPYHARERWRQLLASGAVRLNGRPAGAEQAAASGDILSYLIEDHDEPEVPTGFEIILETPDLLLVGKPAGLPVTRSGKIVRQTLVNVLRRHYRQEIRPLHRLDRETSGLILCARHREASRRHQNRDRTLRQGKYYLALIEGRLEVSGLQVDQPLATLAESPIRCRMWPQPAGKPCRTRFDTLAVTGDRSLLLAELGTGRRHQIRAHLAHLGHPLVGDKIYSHDGHYYLQRLAGELCENDYRVLGAQHHLLHAWSVRLELPERPAALYFSDLLSDDYLTCLQSFPGWREKARRLLEERNADLSLPRP